MHLSAPNGPSRGRNAVLAGVIRHASALADDNLVRRVDPAIDRWVATEKLVGVVAMIARDGGIVYRRAAGFADRDAGIATKQDTIFRLASMTKLIVSVTALALIEEGRLSLGDTAEKWLPYFTPRLADGSQPDITIRQLMTHTSGLSYVFLEPDGNPYQTANVPQGLGLSGLTLEQSLRKLASVPLYYEPGTEWRYSLSTDVLGAVIEKAAGMPLQEAVAHYVTAPLGMADTAFNVVDESRLAAAYRDDASCAVRMDAQGDFIPFGTGAPVAPARALDPDAYPSGGAGMNGTAEDYLRLLEALRTGGSPIIGAHSATALATHSVGNLRAWTEGDGWGSVSAPPCFSIRKPPARRRMPERGSGAALLAPTGSSIPSRS